MYKDRKLWIAQSNKNICMLPQMANRHGLIAGASGTGKTITLKVLAESFSAMGVPVFLQDIKGDVSGMCQPGVDGEKMQKRIQKFGITDWVYKAYPTRFWDIWGEYGHPVRITVSDMGPMLLGRLLGLSDVQMGVLNLVFKIADDRGLLLLDRKDLHAILQYTGDNRTQFTTEYGAISAQSIGAIQRGLLTLEQQGGDIFFGEPALDIADWMRTDTDGRGFINILNSVKLVQNPTLYATFLLWMLSELFEKLPEVGDPEKPRMVFFFDEAHLLFTDAPKALLEKVVQVVKLIRSKGIGIYFITQSPSDIPDNVLAQLSNRVQHALRAYTPAEQKAIRAAAQSFRPNPAFRTEDAMTQMGVGEALVSFLDENGSPGVVERAFILPAQSKMGPADEAVYKNTVLLSEFDAKYRKSIDRESAYEVIAQKAEEEKAVRQKAEQQALQAKKEAEEAKQRAKEEAQRTKEAAKEAAQRQKEEAREEAREEKQKERTQARFHRTTDRILNNVVGSIGRELGRNITRGLFGTRK